MQYVDCPTAKDENFSAVALFLVLLFQQHKMIQSKGTGKSAMEILSYQNETSRY